MIKKMFEFINNFVKENKRESNEKTFGDFIIEIMPSYNGGDYFEVFYYVNDNFNGDFLWNKNYNEQDLKEIFDSIIKDEEQKCKNVLEILEKVKKYI